MFKKYAPHRFLFLCLTMCIALMVMVVALVPVVYAQSTITVNSAADNVMINDGDCTLREAINNVNAGTDTTGGDCAAGTGLGDTIDFASSLDGIAITIAISNTAVPEEDNVERDFDIKVNAIIQGNGVTNTIIDGGGLDRVFHVQDNNTVTFRNLTIQNGDSSTNPGGASDGGGIWVRNLNSAVIIENCLFYNNYADPTGGGLDVTEFATATVNDSAFIDNAARANGGALGVLGGTAVTVSNTLFSGSQANRGGALYVSGARQTTFLNLDNSTLSGNNGLVEGGVLHARDIDADPYVTITIRNSTFANNSSGSGSVFNVWTGRSITVDAQNTILHNNTGSNACSGEMFITSTNNLIDDASCDGAATPVINFDTTLRDNGGFAQTHALLPGSNAIDTGVGSCPDHTGAVLTADPRGQTRPIDYDRDNMAICDIGAFERQADETFTDTVNDGDSVTFGATMSTIMDTVGGTAPSQVTVIRYNQAPGGMPAGTGEMPFQVSITADTPTGLDIDLELCYTDWEVSQGGSPPIVEGDLSLWRWNTGTSSWDNEGADIVDTVNNCATKNNVSALSSWTLASSAPTAITFNGASRSHSSPLWTIVSVMLILLIMGTGVVMFLRWRPQ